ncbi:MAG: radical SAM protein [Spirochaetes bacterium]|nr:radical SAM protein [Spirochaetota bacterium]
MKIKLIYPAWPKLPQQTEFHLPPHGPVNFSASIPADVEVEFIDENVEKLHFTTDCDLICISIMLTSQAPRGWEIADQYRKLGKKVIFGGIATMLHPEETKLHADSVFLGEAETRFPQVLEDFKNNQLKPVYDYMNDFPPIESIVKARREILNYEHYTYRGIKMVDLIHASRGCRFNCFPCCTGYLGGKIFRPRVIDQVVEEMASIDNDKFFIVDNSLAQDKKWEIELFKAIAPLKKRWCCHPIEDDDEVLKYAQEAGAWYVYQAIFDTSDYIRNRVKRYHDHGIGVEGTIILGTDDQDEDYIKRLVDFLLEINLDLAEFTILTPFPHSPIYFDLKKQNRILHSNWLEYNAGNVVFQPKNMPPEQLQNMYQYAWDEFYRDEPQRVKMAKLFKMLKN